MTQINKYSSQELLKELIKKDICKQNEFLPSSFKQEQLRAIEFFTKRAFLEQMIESCIEFNKKLNWDYDKQNIGLTTTAESLIEVFKLRSEVYGNINYQDEFPDTIEGLNFDKYEQNSAVIYCKSNNKITGTTRLIFDSINKLPSEEKYSFDEIRKEYKTIGELSRLIVKNESKGLGLEFKNLMKAIYILFMNNDIDITLLGIKKEHYKLYTKFGGSKIIKELDNYGKIDLNALILSWNPAEVSNFFKRSFLK